MADIAKEVALIQKAARGEEVRDAIVTVFQKLEKDQDDMIQKDQEALDDGMKRSVYDTDGDGIVDNAKKVDGHTVGADVPADAKFTDTDTVYDDADLKQNVSENRKKLSDLQTAVGKAATKEELQAAVDKAATKEELQAVKTELEGKIGNSGTGTGSTESGSGEAGTKTGGNDSGSSGSDTGTGEPGTGAGTKAEVTVDAVLSETSENPVQNKAVAAALKGKQDSLTFDSTPTAGSSNPVTSGGVADAIRAIGGLTKDEVQKMIDTSISVSIDGVLAEEY